MSRQNATNFTSPLQFPYATVGTDLFLKEDVQVLAQAVDQHDHTTGKGVKIPSGALTWPITGPNGVVLSAPGGVANSLQVTSLMTVGPTAPTNTNIGLWVNAPVTANGGLAYGISVNQSLTAAANSDNLTLLTLSPSFVAGAFTNLTQRALMVNGSTYMSGSSGGITPQTLTLAGASNTVTGSGILRFVNSNSGGGVWDFGEINTTHQMAFRAIGSAGSYTNLTILSLLDPYSNQEIFGLGTNGAIAVNGTPYNDYLINVLGTNYHGGGHGAAFAAGLIGSCSIMAGSSHIGAGVLLLEERKAMQTSDSLTGLYIGGTWNLNGQASVATYCVVLAQPSGGTTNQVINTASGAYLSVGGTWTNNPSWAKDKVNIQAAEQTDMDRWFDWMRDAHTPVSYRHPVVWGVTDEHTQTEGVLGAYTEDHAYDHFGFLLDDMPQEIRQVICYDADGALPTKDVEGFLMAMVKVAGQRIALLESRIAVLETPV